jgi:uncharacterized protein (DUF1800 family)
LNIEIGGGRFARFGRGAVATAVLLVVAACGGGNGSSDPAAGSGGGGTPVVAATTPTPAEAARFLTQATMGATAAEITRLSGMQYGAWIDEQMAMPQTLHRIYINQASADLDSVGQKLSPTNFYDSWWSQALGGNDQLRQRTTFALSELFVISFANATLQNQTRGVASYYDMLGEKAFGNFRDLLESVTFHPMMGIYLTHMKNLKEDITTGRVPDLNYAREITQLFAVGEYKLNIDGTNQMGSDGRPVPAYNSADLSGLSQVFTGLSWYAGPELTDRTAARFNGQNPDLSRDWKPMQDYNEYTANTSFHSISAKNFLGTTIAPQTKPDTLGDIKIALDTLFNNPSVGPFVSKQLIQRLVTSNPSPAYVARVATVFNDNGKGVRGDMASVWKAILLDPEARTVNTSPSYGKPREPLLRLSSMLRAFNAQSSSGRYTGIGLTDDPATRLNQTPMFAPTVFNFFRPQYVPTSKAITDANLVAPELQITHELSVAGYLNYIRTWTALDPNRDIKHSYTAEIPLADTPAALVDRMDLLLFSGTMPPTLKTQITDAVGTRVIPGPAYPPGTAASAVPTTTPTNQAAMDAARLDRVYLAVFLSMASPDYQIQK